MIFVSQEELLNLSWTWCLKHQQLSTCAYRYPDVGEGEGEMREKGTKVKLDAERGFMK